MSFFKRLFSRKSKTCEVSMKIENAHVGAIGTTECLSYLVRHQNPEQLQTILADIDKAEQKPYDALTPEQQVMKSEENALRERLRETIKAVLAIDKDKRYKNPNAGLMVQFCGMVIYHSALVGRMVESGIMKRLERPSEDDSKEGSEEGSKEA